MISYVLDVLSENNFQILYVADQSHVTKILSSAGC